MTIRGRRLFERRPAPVVSHVIEEVVLDRPIGGRKVHQAQLQRLPAVSVMRSVEIQVMPTRMEEHPNLGGAFNLLPPKKHTQVAYTEAQGCPTAVHIRDSKNPAGPALDLSPAARAHFLPYGSGSSSSTGGAASAAS
ncbi:Scr1 family TA system antitoxin-like transcriptional regulator [Streptomyces sp. NPDC088766]|uniref:DUF397 domain-containing protein n=1 Tax=Streptomyces sp. NPDC088766 TaxID=3365893 RepID=UPI003809960B